MENCEWRSNIVGQLQNRNKYETAAFQDLVAFQSRLFDTVSTLKTENLQLIRFSGTESSNVGSGGGSNERVQALEQKILAQQEELTSLHRCRGENGQQIINLNAKVHDLEKQLRAKDVIHADNIALIASLRAEIRSYETNMSELQGLNQILRDEHQALQMAFQATEEKLRKAQDENRSLVDRLIKYKSKDADKMNEENDNFVKKKSDKIRKDLEDASRESGSRNSGGSGGSSDEKILDSLPYYATMLPTKVEQSFKAHDGEVYAVKWSPTDRLLATGGADRKINLWDMSKSVEEHKGCLVGSNAAVMSVDFDSTGAYLVAGSNDFASRVYTVGDLRLRHTLTGHSGKVLAAKFLGEPTKVISGSHDRTLKIFDLRNKSCTETKFVGSSCNDLVTSDGSGSTIISGHFDKTIRFWDVNTEACANQIILQGRITSLDLSRDNNYLLACAKDDTIQLIDLRMNQIVRSFSHDALKVGSESRAAFGPGGRFLSVGAVDGTVYVWNTNTGRLEATLKSHTSQVTAVSWHPQTGFLASVDRGKRAIVWGNM